jgi:hypothetical protein
VRGLAPAATIAATIVAAIKIARLRPARAATGTGDRKVLTGSVQCRIEISSGFWTVTCREGLRYMHFVYVCVEHDFQNKHQLIL